jgi:hypothetical protein
MKIDRSSFSVYDGNYDLRKKQTMTGKFRYDMNGNWYKGNTHIHTVASDGGKSLDELAAMYAGQGYDFLFQTDHGLASRIPEAAAPLLWLDGIELAGNDSTGAMFHVVCLGRFSGISRDTDLVTAMNTAREQGGILILAHPHYSGNTVEDALRHGFDGVEVYNHVCRWLNGRSDGLVHWDAMLARCPETLGFAADDAHVTPEFPGWNGGWIMVNAPTRTRQALVAAIRKGNCYATCGPEFLRIEGNEKSVRIATSPVRFVRLVGPIPDDGQRAGGWNRPLVTEARFDIPDSWPTARIEIEDDAGRRAWTNSILSGSSR